MEADPQVWEAAADLLRAGHDVMLEKGRCPRGSGDTQGRVCMGMAIYYAEKGRRTPVAVSVLAREQLRTALPEEWHGSDIAIPNFNDDPATTDDMCFDAFITAEKDCRDRAARVGDGSPATPGGES